MRLLLDSGVWFRASANLPLPAALIRQIKDASEVWLCPISVQEILYKWRHGRWVGPPPDVWLAESLAGCRLAAVTFEAARLAGSWEWSHGDPHDRLLAAVALTQQLTLVHTDRTLKELSGFPQKYFRGLALAGS